MKYDNGPQWQDIMQCLQCNYFIFAALDKQFTVTLDDSIVLENTEATFTCTTNDDEADVVWMIDNKPLPDSDKYRQHDEGGTHTLTIFDVTSEDNCEVTANFGDVSTSAKLVVEGNIAFLPVLMYCMY